MPTITVRNLPDEVHRALRVLAASHGRSTEAEIRHILERTVRPPERVRLGTAMSELSRRAGVINDDIDALASVRDRKPAEPMGLE